MALPYRSPGERVGGLDLSETLTAAMRAVPPNAPRVSVTLFAVERCMIFEHGSHIVRGEFS